MQVKEKELVCHLIRKKIRRLQEILRRSSASISVEQNSNSVKSSVVDSQNTSHSKLAEVELGTLSGNLERLNRESAVNCEECGDEIEFQRLLAIPHTQICSNCTMAAS